jgi:hypothetical protein
MIPVLEAMSRARAAETFGRDFRRGRETRAEHTVHRASQEHAMPFGMPTADRLLPRGRLVDGLRRSRTHTMPIITQAEYFARGRPQSRANFRGSSRGWAAVRRACGPTEPRPVTRPVLRGQPRPVTPSGGTPGSAPPGQSGRLPSAIGVLCAGPPCLAQRHRQHPVNTPRDSWLPTAAPDGGLMIGSLRAL